MAKYKVRQHLKLTQDRLWDFTTAPCTIKFMMQVIVMTLIFHPVFSWYASHGQSPIVGPVSRDEYI